MDPYSMIFRACWRMAVAAAQSPMTRALLKRAAAPVAGAAAANMIRLLNAQGAHVPPAVQKYGPTVAGLMAGIVGDRVAHPATTAAYVVEQSTGYHVPNNNEMRAMRAAAQSAYQEPISPPVGPQTAMQQQPRFDFLASDQVMPTAPPDAQMPTFPDTTPRY